MFNDDLSGGLSSVLGAAHRSDSDNLRTRSLCCTGAADSTLALAASCGMDSLDAASHASALPELPPQPGILSQLRSIQRAADSFNWERRVAGRCKLVGSPASRMRHKPQPHRNPLPSYLQGDAQHNGPRALAKRHELLKSVRIARAARQFWDTLGLGEHAALEKFQYLQVHRLLARALAPEMGADDWAAAAEADWRGDLARGRSVTAEAASRRLGGGGKDGSLGVGGACTLSRQMYERSPHGVMPKGANKKRIAFCVGWVPAL